jgi:transcriptional regulator with XRE-family HTH domain
MGEMQDFAFKAGLRLAAAREILELNQATVVTALDVKANRYNQWEKQTGVSRVPAVYIIAKFSNIYGISLDWIYRGRADTLNPDRAAAISRKYDELLAIYLAEEAAKKRPKGAKRRRA